jgi:hypothetical protein
VLKPRFAQREQQMPCRRDREGLGAESCSYRRLGPADRHHRAVAVPLRCRRKRAWLTPLNISPFSRLPGSLSASPTTVSRCHHARSRDLCRSDRTRPILRSRAPCSSERFHRRRVRGMYRCGAGLSHRAHDAARKLTIFHWVIAQRSAVPGTRRTIKRFLFS